MKTLCGYSYINQTVPEYFLCSKAVSKYTFIQFYFRKYYPDKFIYNLTLIGNDLLYGNIRGIQLFI